MKSKLILNKLTSVLLSVIMIAVMFVTVPLMAFADDEGYAYGDISGRVIKTFTLAGTFDNGRLNNISNRTVAANCEAFLWDSGDGLYYPIEMSSEAILGNYVQMSSTASSGSVADRLLIVSRADGEAYWDSEMYWDLAKYGDDGGAFSDGQEWRIPYGERYIAGYRADGATVDFNNILEYGALEDSTYWPLHDYYGATSNDTLTMLTGFRTTQQNTGWACGTTSALMVLDWFGKRGDLNEQDLAAIRLKTADGGATNLQQLINIFDILNELDTDEWGSWDIYSSYDVAAENGITKQGGAKMNLMSVDEVMDGTMIQDFWRRASP